MKKIYSFEEWLGGKGACYKNTGEYAHKEYIKETFESVRPWFPNDSWEILQNSLYETLLKSYDKEKLKEKISHEFGKEIIGYDHDSGVSPKMLVIQYRYDYEFIKTEAFKQLLNLFNYNTTYIDPAERLIYLEPNIPDEMTWYVYGQCDGVIWHITKNRQAFDNIMKFGLKPKTAAYRKYPERTFFITGADKDEIYKNISKTKNMFFGSENHKELVLLKIDLKKFKKKLRFFMDPAISGMRAIWSSEYIPPFCIEEIKFYDLKKELENF